LNPRTLDLEASTLLRGHRGRLSPTNLSFLHLITLTILGERYKLVWGTVHFYHEFTGINIGSGTCLSLVVYVTFYWLSSLNVTYVTEVMKVGFLCISKLILLYLWLSVYPRNLDISYRVLLLLLLLLLLMPVLLLR